MNQKANSELISARPRSWRRVPRPTGRVGSIALATIGLLILAGAATASILTYRYSQAYEGRFLPGATIAGVPVGGMDRAAAADAVADALAPTLDRTIELVWRDQEWTTTPLELGARTDMDAVLDRALAESDSASFLTKMRIRLLGSGLNLDEGVAVRYPRAGARSFVVELADDVNQEAKDATIDYSTGWVKVVREREGRRLSTHKTHRALMGALRGGHDSIDLDVKLVEPEVTRSEFDKVLLLHIGENELYLYDGGKIKHSWTVATGQPAYPTPTGLFEITLKRYMPTWVNPDPEGWGASMPAMIPPGPANPLGTRALNWSADGIRFHGTSATYSLGHNASHGCVRMAMADVEALYEMIDVGTPVVSVSYGSWSPMTDAAANN